MSWDEAASTDGALSLRNQRGMAIGTTRPSSILVALQLSQPGKIGG